MAEDYLNNKFGFFSEDLWDPIDFVLNQNCESDFETFKQNQVFHKNKVWGRPSQGARVPS